MRAITSYAVKCALILALVLSLSVGGSLAQEVTPEPTVTETPTLPPTEAPTERPTDAPAAIEVPTEVPTEVATEAPADAPTEVATEAPTALPTVEATQPPPPTPSVFTEDWQDNESTDWLLTAGWSLVDEGGNISLTTAAANESAVLTGVNWPYFSLSLRARVAAGGSAQISMAANGQQYQIVIRSDGAASLLRDGMLLGQAAGAVVTSETPTEPVWRTVQILAPGYLLAVKVDDFAPVSYSDNTLTGMGSLIFGTGADSVSAVSFDDISLDQLEIPPPPPVETVAPIPTAVETAEATLEATAEATVESTPEATPEAAQSLALDETGRAKLPAALVEMLDKHLSSDVAGAETSAKAYYLSFDEQGRTAVTLWATTEAGAAVIVSQIQAAGDVVSDVFSVRVNASVTLDNLLALAAMPEVGLVEVPTRAISTSNQAANSPPGYGTGTFISEGVDVLGVAAWQGATTPVKGAGVGIAVIDTGFGSSFPVGIAGEYACLGNGSLQSGSGVAGDTTHGLLVVQTVCDVAPLAQVFMYKATNAATLATAINAASTAGRKVILITMDLGASVSDGDGNGVPTIYTTSDDINNVYTAITNARNSGKMVVVSAGNTSGRYVALNWVGGTTLFANVPVTVFQGDTIHISWNDWNDNLNGSNLEDFTIVLNSGGGISTPVTLKNSSLPSRGAPRASYTIPNGTCAGGCTTSLGFSSYEGDTGNVVIQVQVAGQGTINSGGVTGATVAANAGGIARPADSPDAFAVGAVCNNAFNSFPREATSAIGPVYGSGGSLQSLTAPFTRDQIKPDISGPSHVNINNQAGFVPEDCLDGFGFSGTSAAAAHIAGLAALLVSNTNASMSLFDAANGAGVQGIEDYLQTHAMDMPFFENPGGFVPNIPATIQSDGFDMLYGAGFATLGSPIYNLANTTNPLTPVDILGGVCSGGIIYVGQANPGSLQQGTLANPYVSPAFALRQAAANQCVVLMQGEYMGPLHIPNSVNANGLYSYEAGTSFAASASIVYMTNSFAGNGGLFIEKNNLVVSGLTGQSGTVLRLFSTTGHPKPFSVLGANGFSLLNNTFTGFRLPADVNSSPSGLIKGNTFTGFNIPSTNTGLGLEPESYTAVLDIRNSGNTTALSLENNTFSNTTVATSYVQLSTLASNIVGLKNSTVYFYNNQFFGNSSGTLVGINQWVNGPVANPQPSDKNSNEIRFFGNVFGGSSAGFSNTVIGPLIHAFQSPRLRFVNNSIIKNSMSVTDNNFDTFFLYGYPGVSTNLHIGDRRIEMHNNLFYGNGAVFGGLVANPGLGLGCQNFSNLASVARNNWFSPAVSGGECVGGGNITGSITEVIGVTAGVTEANVFFGATDPQHPWRLKPGTCDTPCVGTSYQGGINTGDMLALSDMFGAPGSPPYPNAFDLRGTVRVSPGGHANSTYNNVVAVDVGAYELEPPLPPTANDQASTIAEDSSASVSFTLTATGGYIQTFALGSPLPGNYDTNPNNACGGQAARFTAPNIVTYCPPANFNTQSPSNSPIVIPFTVTDTLFYPAQPDSGTITLNITKVNDGTPVAANFNMLSDYVVPMTYQLEPRYTLNNFSLTGTGTNVDFPFTFAFGAQTADAGQNPDLLKSCPTCDSTVTVLTNAFNSANSNGGQLLINPVPGQQGFFKFTYTITDGDGDIGTGNGTIVVLPSLAQDGTYDDASFNVAYNGGGWTPSYNNTAYNTTLHASVVGGGSGDSFEIPFTGGQATLNLRGSASGNASTNTLKLQFKLNIGAGLVSYVDYNTAKAAVPALICTDSLNGQQPDGSSNVTNYSATGAAYTVICKGFPLGQAHSIKVTNNLNGAAVTLDSVQIAKGYLNVGVYEETNANFTYTGAWTNYVAAGPKGGSMKYSNGNGANVKFFVGTDVERMIVYRTMATGYGPLDIYVDGVKVATAANAAGLAWAQPFTVTLGPSAVNREIELRNASSSFTGFEALDLLGPLQPLVVGVYEETNSALSYTGTWTDYVAAGPKGGSMKYTNSPTAKVTFRISDTVQKITVYRTQATTYGPVDLYQIVGSTATYLTSIPSTGPLAWSLPFTYTLPNVSNRTLELRNASSNFFGFEAFDLIGAPQRLGAGPSGSSFEETNANLTYTGAWTDYVAAGPKGGSMKYSNGAAASVSFDINNTVLRVVIYRTFANSYGETEILLNGAVQITAPAGTGLTWSQPIVLTIGSPGNHTITVRNKTGGLFTGFEAFDLLPAPQRLGAGPSGSSFEETNPNLTYVSAWTDYVAAGPKGGSMKFSNGAGATVSFDINNTVSRVVIYRTFANNYGETEILLNGAVQITAPAGTGLTWSVPVILTIGSPGDHTITIRNKTGGLFTGFEAFDLLPPLQRLGAGPSGTSYEETNFNLTYVGAWSNYVAAGPKGGSMKFSNGAGATVSFDINNTVSRVVIYRTFANSYGETEILLNGAVQITAPAGTGLTWSQPIVLTIGSPGDHTITVRNKTGGLFTGFEAFDLLPPLQRLGAGPTGTSYEETNFNLTYTGAWTDYAAAGPKGGSMKYSNGAAASVSFDINNTVSRVVIYRTFATNYGETEILLNGAVQITAPAGTGLTWSQPVILTIGSPGDHTITVRNKTGGLFTGFEAFDLLPAPQRLGAGPTGTSYEETNPNLTYVGAWTDYVAAGPKGGSLKFSNGAGATVSFDINNTVSRVVIYRTFANSYGETEILLNGAVQITAPAGTGLTWSQPVILTIGSPGDHTITVRNKTGGLYTGFEAFDLLGPVLPYAPGLYQENHPDLVYTGTWTAYAGAEPLGGSLVYSYALGASLSFQFNGDALAIYSVLVPGGGKLDVSIDGDSVTYPDIVSASSVLRWQQPFIYKGLTSGVHNVVITNTSTSASQPVYIDAIQVYNGVAPLAPGYTQDIDPNLSYTGTWTVDTVGGTTQSSTNGNQMLFQFTGTGFGIFTYNPVNGAPMEVCYKLTPQPDASYLCATQATNAATPQSSVGYSIYGLKSDDYTVRVRHAGTTGTQILYIDGVAVLGTPATVLGAGTYESTNAAIVFTPGALWTTIANASHSGGSTRGTTQKGATAQIRFTGNSLVVYQGVSSTGTNNASLCVVVQGTSVNPPNQCATFSQNAATAAFNSPVAFYGFGSGTHDVVIENRQQGGLLNIDRVTVN